ncbi:hypothetical protein MBRA_06346 [Methylobacterium brachiatum]|nr:hypothetical protein MBRA_06346 [Methylobacterium brachiatum]
MPLSVAAKVAVAHGVVSSATTKALRREADLGRLVIYEVFGRLHTTLGDIKTMIRQSVVSPRAVGQVQRPHVASPSKSLKSKQRRGGEDADSPSKQVIRSFLAATKPPGGEG